MNSGSKPHYHHGDLRSALINATIEMITAHGVDNITMRSLSDWVGVSRTAAYRHFESKEALLTATAIAGFEQFSTALRTARHDKLLDEMNRFKTMGEAYFHFAIQNPAYYQLMFGNAIIQQSDGLSTAATTAYDELLSMIKTLQEKALIASSDPHVKAVYVWSLMHGLASLIINNKLQRTQDLPSILDFFDEAIMASLHFHR